MSTLDNLMTGRLLKQKQNFLMQALYYGPAEKEEEIHREKVERVIDFLDLQSIRRTPVGSLPYGLQKRVELGRALAMEPEILLLDLSMPIMDGWEFLEEYILLSPKLDRKITIYIISSSISPYDIDKAKSISIVTDFIIKPISKEKLIEIFKNL